MTNTLRDITARKSSAVNPKPRHVQKYRAPRIRPLHPRRSDFPSQVSRPHGTQRPTFKSILAGVRQENIARLKDRAFVANRLAKLVAGSARRICYRIKLKAVSVLLTNRAASLNSVMVLDGESIFGLTLAGGGKLHVPAFGLDSTARAVLQQELQDISRAIAQCERDDGVSIVPLTLYPRFRENAEAVAS